MPTVPEWFLRELHQFDADLRVRWSPRRELWQLERRVTRSLHPGTIRNDGWHDDYIRAQDGFILVAEIPPRQFHRTIFDKLRASDLWSNGGWEKVADEIEALEQAEEDKKWANFSDDIAYRSKEIYEWWKIRDGRTVFSHGWAG